MLSSGERFRVHCSEDAVHERVSAHTNPDGPWITLPGLPGSVAAQHIVRTYPLED